MNLSKRRTPCFFFFILFFLFNGCHYQEPDITRSYYFWRSGSYLQSEEIHFLSSHHISRLYAKLLDVDWRDVYGAVPVSSQNLDELNQQMNVYDSLRIQIVPVIFITNKTFEKIDSLQIPLLARRVVRRCLPGYDSMDVAYEKANAFYEGKSSSWQKKSLVVPKEIQFDCDWTISTSKQYFRFLQSVRSLLPHGIQLSATVRLHQYKYPSKTGVPPVDKGMLMMYNITDPKKYTNTNSIFDYDKAKAYFTSGKKYPLPLDIVLPAYSWCLIYRNGQFYQVENNIIEKEIKTLSFLQKENNGFYKVTADTVYKDVYLRTGDEVKPEGISEEALAKASQLSMKAVNSSAFSVAMFELSKEETTNYSYETIENIYNTYRHSR